MICQLLLRLSSPTFNRESVSFCTCMINNPDASIQEIQEELGTNVITILRNYTVDTTQLLSFVNQINIVKVQVEIYRAAGKVDEALSIIWGKGENADIQNCVQFCKESPDPSAAFERLLILMDDSLPSDKKTTIIMNLLSENMSEINISSAFSYISSDQPISKVIPFLENSYRSLVAMRKDAELDASFAAANEFETHYQAIKLESQCFQLRNSTVCSFCQKPLGYQYVQRAPNGMTYHYKCIQNQK